jgi:putative endonuclease
VISKLKNLFKYFSFFKNHRTVRQKLGDRGEVLAADFLHKERGMRIVARNWMYRGDEIDIVARLENVLIFVEVRTRAPAALVSGYSSITAAKKRTLLRVFKSYLRGLKSRPAAFRFDVVEIKLCQDSEKSAIVHYENVPLFPKDFFV